jgi:hypothetical protein
VVGQVKQKSFRGGAAFLCTWANYLPVNGAAPE